MPLPSKPSDKMDKSEKFTHATTGHMTGAELQTLREASGMTRDGLASLAGVEARTVKHWETRKGAAVPADVAQIVRNAARWVLQASAEALRTVQEAPHAVSEVVLIRYRETAHMHATDRAQGLMADVHGGMVCRLVLDLMAQGTACRVVWFDPDAYNAWREDLRHKGWGQRVEILKAWGDHTGQPVDTHPDTPAHRAAWAAGPALGVQAIPHPGDQPPAGYTPQR